uniref:Uncharacterized protein n=1 Tax=Ciona intestinalis TaxID=7719 RepID=H2Y3M6_CIOIN
MQFSCQTEGTSLINVVNAIYFGSACLYRHPTAG